MSKLIVIFIIMIFFFSCQTKQHTRIITKEIITQYLTLKKQNKLILFLEFISPSIRPAKDFESYAILYLNRKQVGSTNRKLLSQKKHFQTFLKKGKRYQLKMKVYHQNPYRKKWEVLKENNQPSLYDIKTTQKSGIVHLKIQYYPENRNKKYSFTEIWLEDEKKINHSLKRVLFSYQVLPIEPNSEKKIYLNIYLDNQLLVKTKPTFIHKPNQILFYTHKERHLFKAEVYFQESKNSEFKRLFNIRQPKARHFYPDGKEKNLRIIYFPNKKYEHFKYFGFEKSK